MPISTTVGRVYWQGSTDIKRHEYFNLLTSAIPWHRSVAGDIIIILQGVTISLWRGFEFVDPMQGPNSDQDTFLDIVTLTQPLTKKGFHACRSKDNLPLSSIKHFKRSSWGNYKLTSWSPSWNIPILPPFLPLAPKAFNY